MSKSPIVFLCAMHSEWEAVSRGVEQAGAQERARVVHTGMGMLRAAHGVLDAWHRMADFAQCKVISAGLCGVLEHGREPFSIGEVVTPAKVCSEPMIPQELIESGFAEKVHPTEFELGFIPQIGNGEGTAHCLESAWKFVERPPTRNAHLPGRVVDMEAFAIASQLFWLQGHLDNFGCIKVVSDNGNGGEFARNMACALERLTEGTKSLFSR